MKGVVKWFNNKRGYGFIKSESGEDVFLFWKEIQGESRNLIEGEPVTYEVKQASKGPMATKVVRESMSTTEEKPSSAQKIPEQELVALALFNDQIKFVSLTPDGNYRFIDEAQNLHSIIYVASSETLSLQTAVEELESLMNDLYVKEKDFQDFFERNPDFILNDEYKKAHPHIVLTKDEGESLIPDFVLEPVDQNSLCDLLELKLPSVPIFVLQKRRTRFSAAVMEACAQLREYSSFFDEEKNRNGIQERYGLLTYRPKMFVIIGRRGNINPIQVRKVQADLPSLCLRTYDDVLVRMKARIDAMKKGRFRI